MLLKNAKSKMWGCLVCKCLKNNIRDEKCSICSAKRERDRFGLSVKEMYYLCHVNTAQVFPDVTITCVTSPESNVTVKLPMIRETLEEAVREAVVSVATAANIPAASEPRSCFPEDSAEALPADDGTQAPGTERRLDLYHRVMANARDVEYDAIMGQFVPTVSRDSEPNKDLKYVQSMKKEKDVMDKVVKNTILQRGEESPHTKDINANADNLNEWRAKVPCALCCHLFPPAQLLGSISNQSVLHWMKERQVPTDSKACKKMSLQAYEAAKICLFCTQFFDENYADIFDVEISANAGFRHRRTEEKEHQKGSSQESRAIEKFNEKLSIAELKSKKEALSVRQRASQEEGEVNAQQILKLQGENRSMKFQEAKEKFRRHKVSLASKKSVVSKSHRNKSASSLPSVEGNRTEKRLGEEAGGKQMQRNEDKSNGPRYTSRSAGCRAGNVPLADSASDSKLKVRRKPRRKVASSNSAAAVATLPAISPPPAHSAAVGEHIGRKGGGGGGEGGDAIEDALKPADSVLSPSSVTKSKKKRQKRKNVVVNRTTKKEAARLELLKEIADKKEKEERRLRARKRRAAREWDGVRVGEGGEERDMKVFRDKEKQAAMLIKEYERDIPRKQREEVLMGNQPGSTSSVTARPDWDSSDVQHPGSFTAATRPALGADECSDEEDDFMELEPEVEVKEVERNAPCLKPTISLEMLQQHKQHLQAMHLKQLEIHIENQNLEAESRPPTEEAPARTSITREMLDKHKKHVLSMQKSIDVANTHHQQGHVKKHFASNRKTSSSNLPLDLASQAATSQNGKPLFSAPVCEAVTSEENGNDDEYSDDMYELDDDDDCACASDGAGENRGCSERSTEKGIGAGAGAARSVHHDEDIDANDGFDCAFGGLGSDDSQEVREDDEDADTPAMVDCAMDIAETGHRGVEMKKGSSKMEFSLPQNLYTIVSHDASDCGDGSAYEGFDSLMDSLQEQATKEVKHSRVTLLAASGTAQRRAKGPMRSPRRAGPTSVGTERGCKHKQSDENDADTVEDAISFDDEDDTPMDVDDSVDTSMDSEVNFGGDDSSPIRCSPVTIEQEQEIEDKAEIISNGHSDEKQNICDNRTVSPLKTTRSQSRGAGSRRGVRTAGKSSRLDPYENPLRPSSKSFMRPISKSSVRKGSRIEQYDNSTGASVSVGDQEGESSRRLSSSGVFSPPSSASVRRRVRDEKGSVNKLQVMGARDMQSSSSVRKTAGGVGSRASSPPSSGGSVPAADSSSPAARRCVDRKEADSESINKKGGSNDVAVGSVRQQDENSKSSGHVKNTTDVLPLNFEHREQSQASRRRARASARRSSEEASSSAIHDSKKDQQNRRHSRLPHRNASMSKISEKIDNTPSLLDLSIMKFNGEMKLKREDSFAKLTKRIIGKQESNSPSKRIMLP